MLSYEQALKDLQSYADEIKLLRAALIVARKAVAQGDSSIGILNQIDATLDPVYRAKLTNR